ncbi:MAG: endonuclease/exonuclease/phosphatase family protein [Phycisphaerae bacterium]|nr:endonuclease/exonuclease/phosphatase family protein [Phycisphaerae bacterium]
MFFPIAVVLAVGAIAPAQTDTFMDRHSPSDVRVVTYNVNWDSIFPDGDRKNHRWRESSRAAAFRRIVAALRPDIMCLQEINPARNAQEVADIFDETVPLGDRNRWHVANGGDSVIVSRYPLSMIAEVTDPPGQREQAMALVDLPNHAYDRDIYVMNEHYKCCDDNRSEEKRQQQSDALVSWMHDARSPDGSVGLPYGTPMVVLGDLNLVEGPGPLNTLLTGDIEDERTYGSDSPPDWDGSDATDAHPLHNGVGPDDYTWREDGGSFKPARLDFIIFTDSVVATANKFVLNTTIMSPADLDATGLQQYDVVLDPPGGFDHLPVVVDLRFPSSSGPAPARPDGDVNLDGRTDLDDIGVFVDLYLAGPLGDSTRIAHADYSGNGVIDGKDLPAFLDDLSARPTGEGSVSE